MAERGNPKTWQATLTPHRSLSRQGFLTVMSLVAVVNFAVGILFFAIGAWPVAGFAGLDVLLIWWAFRANFADARISERISITDHDVIIERLDRHGHSAREGFVRRWVRVELEEDRERELIGALHLVSGARRIMVGAFLPPDERKSLALALRQALAIPRI